MKMHAEFRQHFQRKIILTYALQNMTVGFALEIFRISSQA
jgi:hypothetical protein